MGIFDRDFKPVLAVAPHLKMHKLTIGEKVGAATCRYSTIFSISFCKASVKSKL